MSDTEGAGAAAATKRDIPTRARVSRNQKRFLIAFAQLGNVGRAADVARIHRSRHYEWLEDPNYKKQFDAAGDAFTDLVREEIRRRAIEGVLEPVFQGGRRVADMFGQPASIRRYSDRMLEILSRRCPELRDKTEITGANGGPVELKVVRYPEKEPDAQAWAARQQRRLAIEQAYEKSDGRKEALTNDEKRSIDNTK